MNPKLWICAVRREAFVGGESQRCRHPQGTPVWKGECGEMELIGGEPLQWCVVHNSERFGRLLENAEDGKPFCGRSQLPKIFGSDPCLFESNVRVKVTE